MITVKSSNEGQLEEEKDVVLKEELQRYFTKVLSPLRTQIEECKGEVIITIDPNDDMIFTFKNITQEMEDNIYRLLLRGLNH